MNIHLDETYLSWLYSQVGAVKQRSRSRSHWSLLRQLYKTEFVWLVPNDDNRVEDGRDLRYEFVAECDLDPDPAWFREGCSMLEMLIGLARRLSFEDDGAPSVWFWHLIEVMDLEGYNDRHYNAEAERTIAVVLDRVIYRKYQPDGTGGLFPLLHPKQDQREVELWYQLNAYLVELS